MIHFDLLLDPALRVFVSLQQRHLRAAFAEHRVHVDVTNADIEHPERDRVKAVEVVGIEERDLHFGIVSVHVIADFLHANGDKETVFAEIASHKLLARVTEIRLDGAQDLLGFEVVDAEAVVEIVVVVLQRRDARQEIARIERQRRRDAAGRNRIERLHELILHHGIRLGSIPAAEAVVAKRRMRRTDAGRRVTTDTPAAASTTTATTTVLVVVVIIVRRRRSGGRRGGGGGRRGGVVTTSASVVIVIEATEVRGQA